MYMYLVSIFTLQSMTVLIFVQSLFVSQGPTHPLCFVLGRPAPLISYLSIAVFFYFVNAILTAPVLLQVVPATLCHNSVSRTAAA